MRILVCGGRDYTNGYRVSEVLMNYVGKISLLIEGGAKGADFLAGQWADDYKIMHLKVPAQWDKYGKKAGHMRNTVMLQALPNLVIAFPGGRGTADMVKQAKAASVEVLEINEAITT